MGPRIVFMGSPEFSLPALRTLMDSYALVGVVTQPDRPAGRGQETASPPVKHLALEYRVPVIQPLRLRDPDAFNQVRSWEPDLIVVAAYGQILRPEVLDLPRFGSLNVHASLLPRWRGASPIQHAILAGDSQTGVTIMKMDAGLDTGPILLQRSTPIHGNETAGELSQRLAELGAKLLSEALPQYLQGEIVPTPQNDTAATYAPIIKKEAGRLDFSRPAVELARQVRAFNPWPGAYLYWNNQLLKIHRAHPDLNSSVPEGRLSRYGPLPVIGTSEGILVLDEVQPAGRNRMNAELFLRGARGWGE